MSAEGERRRSHPYYKRLGAAYELLEHEEFVLRFRFDLLGAREEIVGGSETWLYAILDEEGGAVKIGIAANPRRRLSHLQIGNPRRLLLLGACPATGELERYIHRRLEPWRIHGEWFLTDDHVLAIVDLILAGEDAAKDFVTADMAEWIDCGLTIDHITLDFAEALARAPA